MKENWNKIFEKLSILDHVHKHGFFDISADQIKKISQCEPRLMAKFDFRESLPSIMRDNALAMLAIANGKYRIGRFDPFIEIQENSCAQVELCQFPKNIISLNPKMLTQESAVLDAALISNVLAKVVGEEVRLTIRGRSRNAPFHFRLNGIPFNVEGVQIEVDGGYEGDSKIALIEAKIGPRSSLSIRQLLYPQLAWESAVGSKKKVVSFACFYQEPILRFIPIIAGVEGCHADHSSERAFALEKLAKIDLMAIKIKQNTPVPIRGVPFPQADNFDTVLAMLSVVASRDNVARTDLLEEFGIVDRQIKYYLDVLRWLGLVDETKGGVRINGNGLKLAKFSHAERIEELAEIIFGEPVFNAALHHGIGQIPEHLFERWCITGSTIERRKQTVAAWVKYFRAFAEKQ